jgi:anti-sigma B factor antagonist
MLTHREQLAPDVTCLEVSGEFDLARAYEVDAELRGIEALGARTIVVDLREVTFVDSAGLARIMAARRRAEQAGRRFVLVRGCRSMERLLRMTALTEQLEMVSEPRAVL